MAAISNLEFKPIRWQTIVIAALAFWLSSSLLLDFIIMPGMYAAGMMAEPGFVSAGYSIFWLFNRVELLCAAFVLTGVLILNQVHWGNPRHRLAIAALLLSISLIYTYGLTPTMSALGIQLDWFNLSSTLPDSMLKMQTSYWVLELVKLAAAGTLLGMSYRGDRTFTQP